MGQSFIIVNETKREYIDPHEVGKGSKLLEVCEDPVSNLLPYLLRQCEDLSPIDIALPHSGVGMENAGRWAGDEIVVVGDYCRSRLYWDVVEGEEYEAIGEQIAREYGEWLEHGNFGVWLE